MCYDVHITAIHSSPLPYVTIVSPGGPEVWWSGWLKFDTDRYKDYRAFAKFKILGSKRKSLEFLKCTWKYLIFFSFFFNMWSILSSEMLVYLSDV